MAQKSSTLHFMAPCGSDENEMFVDLPHESDLISHQFNSHTLQPKIVGGPNFHPDFHHMEGHYLIDFPGIFETRGSELDIAMHLILQKLLLTAKSAKVLVLVSATILTPDQNSMIDFICKELSLMFSKPKEHLVIGITKTRLVANVIDKEDIVDVALGEGGENRSFKGYRVCIVEQDDRQSLGEMLKQVIQKGCVK